MSQTKLTRLSHVVSTFADHGTNDNLWFLIEHQLAQAKMSVQIALQTSREIAARPESEHEREVAKDVEEILAGLYRDVLEHYATFLSYIAGTGVAARIGDHDGTKRRVELDS